MLSCENCGKGFPLKEDDTVMTVMCPHCGHKQEHCNLLVRL